MSALVNPAGPVPFGKYTGRSFEYVVAHDLPYARWMLAKSRLRVDYRDRWYDLEMLLSLPSLRRDLYAT